ncbi:hypothetical protein Dimus_023695 [Dionaea muscipula]
MASPSAPKGKQFKGTGAASSTDYDTSRFLSRENQEWYEAHAPNKFIVEKTISGGVDNVVELTSRFESLGWESILELDEGYYPDLVREFFANMDAKENPLCPLISTWVRGAEIEVTCSSLAHDLQIPDVGFPFALLGDEEVGDPTYSYPVALQRLGLHYRLDEGKKSVV